MIGDEDRDQRIAKLLRAVHAEAEPALWTRVRARIEARERTGWIGWLMRPAALRSSLALLAAVVVASAVLLITAPRTTTSASTADSLEDALVAEVETPAVTTGPAHATAPRVNPDSGSSR